MSRKMLIDGEAEGEQQYDFDLFVIGGGSGGVRASRTSAAFGAKVAICELPFHPISSEVVGGLGGTCVIRGCVPKKILVYGAQFGGEFEDARNFGWELSEKIDFNWKKLLHNKTQEITRLNGIYNRMLTNAGVTVLEGLGRIVNFHMVEVIQTDGSKQQYSAKHILIATGSRAQCPPIVGQELGITSDEALSLEELPKRAVVYGGGYIAVEFASIWRGMGAKVDLFYRKELPLRGFDDEMREVMARNLQERGITLHPGTNLSELHKTEDGIRVVPDHGDELKADVVLFATGRSPNTKRLNLEAVGVELDKSGAIKVDEYSCSTVPSIWAVGDVTNRMNKEVLFMLPSLLGLLLDCAKKTDQTVVSIALGALVHLIEVGGHQFSDNDWDTLLQSIRDAAYTTQPLELLNSLGFDISKKQTLHMRAIDVNGSDVLSFKGINHGSDSSVRDPDQTFYDSEPSGRNIHTEHLQMDYQGTYSYANLEESEGLPSPSSREQKPADSVSFQRSQTFGQRIMGNMMDNLLLRTLTSKSKSHLEEVETPSSPIKVNDTDESGTNGDLENPLMDTIRGKCITQLLLLGALNSIQTKYWTKLKSPQKMAIMDILLSLLEFAASYNSTSNLRTRMHQIPSDWPPLNLLRQEIEGTSIYLDILHKATSTYDPKSDADIITNGPMENIPSDGFAETVNSEEKLKSLAEENLVAFCGQILKDASDLQPNNGEAASADIHRVLDLRAPVIVKVLKGMCLMESQIFRKHLRDFYPLITKLVCCDQMDVRGALGDLFSTQLTSLLP